MCNIFIWLSCKKNEADNTSPLVIESPIEKNSEADFISSQEIQDIQQVSSVKISFVTDGYEGGMSISSEYEDYYWTKAKLQGEDLQEASKEMSIVFTNQMYSGKYGFSSYSLVVLFQTDTYSTEDGIIFEINHDTNELVGIYFPDMENPREEIVSKEEAVIIAQQFLQSQFQLEESLDWLDYTVDNQVYDNGAPVPYYIIRFYSTIDDVRIIEDVNVIVGTDGVIEAFQASKLKSFLSFLNNHSWEEIEEILQQLTKDDVEEQINIVVTQQLGWSESQIKERKMIIDETGRPTLICYVLGSKQGEDQDGSWVDAELLTCIIRQP